MIKNRKNLLGSAIAGALGVALLCGAGAAQAQGYRDNDRAAGETVTVSPYQQFDRIQAHNMVGRVDGEINPAIMSISHPVSYADLDLRQEADFAELHARVSETARDLCDRLADRFSDMRDASDHRQCVRNAIRSAMAQVPETPAG